MKKQIIRAMATTMLALGLSTGVAAAQSGSISNTGASSKNIVNASVNNKAEVKNHNLLGVASSSSQNAGTGSASVDYNTTGGSATSGSSSNTSSSMTTIDVSN